jgi:hypothetical protein
MMRTSSRALAGRIRAGGSRLDLPAQILHGRGELLGDLRDARLVPLCELGERDSREQQECHDDTHDGDSAKTFDRIHDPSP